MTTEHDTQGSLPADETTWRDLRVTAQDGLTLAAREYGDRLSHLTPVVCLPGLTRSARDFHTLAEQLSMEPDGRRVLSIEYRGRGRSQYDPNWKNYNVFTELADCLAVMDAAGIQHAVLVGTSRGGILTMMLGAARPSVLSAVVLVDIGPVIGMTGLAAIKKYLTNMPKPASWEEAAQIMKSVQSTSFTNQTDIGWMEMARATFRDDGGKPAIDFDLGLLKTLEDLDLETPLPALWPQFDGLTNVPVLAVRGENSTIFNASTLDEMADRHPMMETLVVEHQGHAPILEGAVAERIARFIQDADRRH